MSLILMLTNGCTSLFFYPEKGLYDNPALHTATYQDVLFESSDGVALHGWFFPAKTGTGKAVIIQLHGNAENMSTHVNSVLWLTEAGYDLFTFDYRGYGRSEGKPTIAGIHRDAQAALTTVLNLPEGRGRPVILLGQSLGAAAAVYLMAKSPDRDRVRALILDSPFAGYRRIAREKMAATLILWPFQYPLSLLVDDDYSPERWIQRISPTIPILFIHGDQDPVIPSRHSSRLYEMVSGPKELWLVKGVGHTGALGDPDIRKRLLDYLHLLAKKSA